MKPASHPRAIELLAERAMRPLDDKEHWELHELGAEDDDSFDLAAAGVALALTPIEPMPADLAQKLFDASPVAGTAILPSNIRTIPGIVAPRSEIPRTDIEQMREKKRVRPAAIIPWLAAAACLALAIGAVLWARTDKPATPTLSQARDELMAKAADVAKLEWTATADPNAKGATGDVVWSQSEQKGFMRFVGLTPNDATKYQYQLWIFDKNRDDKFPVDGGVFDVSSDGEVIIPIAAKLAVSEATLFAVTIEKPGGVVVSARERIVVTAQRKS